MHLLSKHVDYKYLEELGTFTGTSISLKVNSKKQNSYLRWAFFLLRSLIVSFFLFTCLASFPVIVHFSASSSVISINLKKNARYKFNGIAFSSRFVLKANNMKSFKIIQQGKIYSKLKLKLWRYPKSRI